MAYVPRSRARNRDQNRIIVSGRDLVIPTPQSLPVGPSQTAIFQCIPANPVYWTGTRISKQAEMYQVFRPRRFHVHYKPQVAVTNPGLVVYGTLFQDATVDVPELQQVLNTSNGGGISQCYMPFTSRVDLRALQLKQFNVIGSPSSTDNVPFSWVAAYTGYAESAITTSSAPGWVEVDWEFEFMSGNPGSGNTGAGVFVYPQALSSRLDSRRRAVGSRAINWSAPFGIPLGALKEMATPLLRHIGVVLLNGASTDSFRYGIGKILTWVASSLAATRSTDGTTLRDDDGSEVTLPDDTPVIVLMSGLPQPTSSSQTEAQAFLNVRATVTREAQILNCSWMVSELATTIDEHGVSLRAELAGDAVSFQVLDETVTSMSVRTADGDTMARTEDMNSILWYYRYSTYHWMAISNVPAMVEAPAEEEELPEQPAPGLTTEQRRALLALLA